MSQAPSMPLFVDAYLADTTHLSTEEHGAYLMLLMAMWRRGGSVPDSDRDNARITGLSMAKWSKVKPRLMEFLAIENGDLTQKRLKREWEYVQEKRQKNAQNGTKGGRPKSLENKGLAKANGSVSDNPDESPHSHTQKEEKETPSGVSKNSGSKRGSRIDPDWKIPEGTGAMAQEVGLSEADVKAEAAKFRDFWISKPGQGGVKLDWTATWRNWLRRAAETRRPVQRQGAPPDRPVMMADYAANLLKTIEANRNDEPADHNGPEIDASNG